MALTKEEVEKRWAAKRAKGRQTEDLAAKQRKAAEEAARRRQQNEEAAAKQRKAKDEVLKKQREVLEEAQKERELQEQVELERLQQEMQQSGADASIPEFQPVDHVVASLESGLHAGAEELVQDNIPALPDMEEVIGSIDRMEFFDLGKVKHVPDDFLPALEQPAVEVVQKPEEDVAGVEERRARFAAKAKARRQAFDTKVREAIADAQVSAMARHLRPKDFPIAPQTPGQQRPKAAVRMPRRMKIGGDLPVVEAVQPMQMPSSGLSVGGISAPITAQAAASSSSSSFRPAPPSGKQEAAPASMEGHEQFVGVSLDAEPEPPVMEAPLDGRHKEAIANLERGAVELEDLDDDLRAHRQVVQAALRIDGHALAYASEDLRNDRETALAAVYESGLAIRHAGPRPRRDREVLLVAVMDAGAALEFASRELQGDREVVLTAIESDPDAVRFAAESLMDDRDFVLAAAQTACRTFEHASLRLRSDWEVVMAVVASSPDAFMHAAPELRCDRDFVLAVVKESGCAIAHASPELRRDPEVRAAAIASDPLAAAAAQD